MLQQTSSQAPVVHFKWNDYRRSYSTRAGNGWGSHVLEYAEIDAGTLKARLLVVPVGQGSVPRVETEDLVLVNLSGAVQVEVGSSAVVMVVRDQLTIPAGTTYRFFNIDLNSAVLFAARNIATTSTDVKGGPSGASMHMLWDDCRRRFRWGLPFADKWGMHRGSGPRVSTEHLVGHMVQQPVGQGSPWHASSRDLIFIQLEGSVQFNAAGERWGLEPFDLFMMRYGTPYSYSNVGTTEVLFFDIGGNAYAAGGSTYYADDPGWPVRADAVKLSTALDPTGSSYLSAHGAS